MCGSPTKKAKASRDSARISEPLSLQEILERSIAFAGDVTTLAILSRVSSGIHRIVDSTAQSQVESLAKTEPLRHEIELNSVLFEVS